jgi:hypothetical protein
MGGGNRMKKWYKAKIREDIPDNFNYIPEIKEFAGRHIYVSYDKKDCDSCFGNFVGKVSNTATSHWWSERCFSEMIEI